MPRALRLLAPAKINLMLEVLGRRGDGYHEIVTVMQSIDLYDEVTLELASDITLTVSGEAADSTPVEIEDDLAYLAAKALASHVGGPGLGVGICIEKRIPAGMGLGGGSSDAAAVLRGLNRLWSLDLPAEALATIGATLGSDVTFFLHCGTALCSGRGEIVEALQDAKPEPLTLFLPLETIERKTARMYGLLRESDFSMGAATQAAVDALSHGAAFHTTNVFDARAGYLGEQVESTMSACREAGIEVHLAGSGPAFFTLMHIDDLHQGLIALLKQTGMSLRQSGFLGRGAALAMGEL